MDFFHSPVLLIKVARPKSLTLIFMSTSRKRLPSLVGVHVVAVTNKLDHENRAPGSVKTRGRWGIHELGQCSCSNLQGEKEELDWSHVTCNSEHSREQHAKKVASLIVSFESFDARSSAILLYMLHRVPVINFLFLLKITLDAPHTTVPNPDATIKILISTCLSVDSPASALPSDNLNTDKILMPGQSSD